MPPEVTSAPTETYHAVEVVDYSPPLADSRSDGRLVTHGQGRLQGSLGKPEGQNLEGRARSSLQGIEHSGR